MPSFWVCSLYPFIQARYCTQDFNHRFIGISTTLDNGVTFSLEQSAIKMPEGPDFQTVTTADNGSVKHIKISY